MKAYSKQLEAFLLELPEERKEAFRKLFKSFHESLDSKFEVIIEKGMIHFCVPLSIYPKGYHCKPSSPLPFIFMANQKNFIAVYHMGLYANEELLEWFVKAYQKNCTDKLDMGKSCIRFKKPANIPYALMGELASKMTMSEWVNCYESKFVKNNSKA